jgi:hypothetical protein
MNRVNPLYIGALLVMVLGFTFVQLQQSKMRLETLEGEYAQSLETALTLRALREAYDTKQSEKKNLVQHVDTLIKRGAAIEKIEKKSSLSLKSDSLELKQLETLFSKILNANYKIDTLRLERINQESVRLQMEIQW